MATLNRIGWGLWGLGVLGAWGGMAAALWDGGLQHPYGLASILPLDVLVSPAALVGVSALCVLCCVLFVAGWKRQRLATAWASVLLLYSHLELSVYPDNRNDGHGDILPGATLIFWVLFAWSTRGDRSERERAGLQAACGVVGAVYLWAAVSKLAASGPLWALKANLPLLIAERSLTGPEWVRAFREAVATSPALCIAMGTGALLIELCGPLFLWPRFRPAVALLLICMHAGVGVLMGYFYVEWWITLIGLTLITRVRTARS